MRLRPASLSTGPSRRIKCSALLVATFFLSSAAAAQTDDFCTEFGSTPSLNSPFANIPYIFGRITYKGVSDESKLPRIQVILIDGDQTNKRVTVGRSGNYCFRRTGGSATLIVEVDGIEAARRSFASFGAAQQREDFEISSNFQKAAPATVSAKFTHPQNQKTIDLYRKAQTLEVEKKTDELAKVLKEIVAIDPADFIAWAKLGSVHLERKAFSESEAALRKSIELKLEYTPAWINFGQLRLGLKQYEAAIEVLKHVITLNPTSARGYQLLGEAYLLAKQGSLGAEALNQAIKLDPIGMAECHLQLAHLYQLAGAKEMAITEYKAFLSKVPDYPDRKKLEKYISDNSPK